MSRSTRLGLASLLASMILVRSSHASDVAAEWLVAMYLNADNNLERSIVQDFREVAELPDRSDTHVRIIALLDRSGRYADDEHAPREPASGTFILSDPAVVRPSPLGEHRSMSDPRTLVEFLASATRNRSSRKRAVVVSAHGDGPRGVLARRHTSTGPASVLLDNGNQTRGLLYDETDDNYVSLDAFAESLASAGGISVLGLDACLMGTLEVAVALHGVADYLVASEHEVIGEGWDHSIWARRLFLSAGEVNPEDLAASFVDAFIASGQQRHSTFERSSALATRIASAPELARQVNAAAAALLDMFVLPEGKDVLESVSIARTQCGPLASNIQSNTVDLACFFLGLRNQIPAIASVQPAVWARFDLATTMIDRILCSPTTCPDALADSMVITDVIGKGLRERNYRGLSIYLPATRAAASSGVAISSYKHGNHKFFSLVPSWLALIDAYLASRRD
jgi:hypothetical protein